MEIVRYCLFVACRRRRHRAVVVVVVTILLLLYLHFILMRIRGDYLN